MIVVCDTSPINYLLIIRAEWVLEKLFQEIYVPPEVMQELLHEAAPDVVRCWATQPPGWVRVASATSAVEDLDGLGPGEVHAMALAVELGASWLLIDERDGARIAKRRGLRVIGTLGVLETAAREKLLDLRRAMEDLQKTTFRSSPALVRAILERMDGHNTPGK